MDHIRSYYAASAQRRPAARAAAGRRDGRRLRGRRRHRRLLDRAAPRRARLQGRAARGQAHRAGAPRVAAAARRSSASPPGRTSSSRRSARDDGAAHVRRLGRGARPAQGARRAPRDRLRPALGPDARRDQAAARDGTARPGARNWPRDYGYTSLRWLDRDEVRGAARDRTLHRRPATTRAAATCIRSTTRSASPPRPRPPACAIFEGSQVTRLEHGDTVSGATRPAGRVRAKHVALCCNAYMDEPISAKLRARIMPVGTYIVATEPLGAGAHARR